MPSACSGVTQIDRIVEAVEETLKVCSSTAQGILSIIFSRFILCVLVHLHAADR